MKTTMMQFRVAEDEKALIEKCAKKAGMTVSEYIRASLLMEMVIDGELKLGLKRLTVNHLCQREHANHGRPVAPALRQGNPQSFSV